MKLQSQGVSRIIFKDPVCGKRINRGKAHVVIEYEGVNYFICCPRCQTEFEHNLKFYARPELGEKAKKVARVPHQRQPNSVGEDDSQGKE